MSLLFCLSFLQVPGGFTTDVATAFAAVTAAALRELTSTCIA